MLPGPRPLWLLCFGLQQKLQHTNVWTRPHLSIEDRFELRRVWRWAEPKQVLLHELLVPPRLALFQRLQVADCNFLPCADRTRCPHLGGHTCHAPHHATTIQGEICPIGCCPRHRRSAHIRLASLRSSVMPGSKERRELQPRGGAGGRRLRRPPPMDSFLLRTCLRGVSLVQFGRHEWLMRARLRYRPREAPEGRNSSGNRTLSSQECKSFAAPSDRLGGKNLSRRRCTGLREEGAELHRC